jgi:hypothetical protein
VDYVKAYTLREKGYYPDAFFILFLKFSFINVYHLKMKQYISGDQIKKNEKRVALERCIQVFGGET